jgi:hypothetical protein
MIMDTDHMVDDGESDASQAASIADDDFSPEDEELAVLLSEGMSQVAAADAVGISSKTVQRRLKDARFRRRVAELRWERPSARTARLIRMSDPALDVLERLLDSEDEAIRLRAAQAVLTLGHRRHREEVIDRDLMARLEAIEGLLDIIEAEMT